MTGTENDVTTRKPRVALMGEFSAGKSTLTNMLLGCDPLPVRVTATQLPPVWISFGSEAAFRVGLDGSETPLDLNDLENVAFDETRYIRLFLESDTLQLCDLIDMPGISDPNMSHEVWQRVMDEADCVIWCTHATQAWRQSEAATWDSIKDATNGDNLLLVTQFDKLGAQRDRARVMARIGKETKGLFKSVFPVSLTEAINAGDDIGIWKNSGAAAFTEALVEMLLNPAQLKRIPPRRNPDPAGEAVASAHMQGDSDEPDASFSTQATPENAETSVEPVAQVTPNRVRLKAAGRLRTRPLQRSDPGIDAALAKMEAGDGL